MSSILFRHVVHFSKRLAVARTFNPQTRCTWRAPLSLGRTRAMGALGLATGVASGMAIASCDPVEAIQALWTFVTVGRKDYKVREEMKVEIQKIRDEFHLKNVDISNIYERFHGLSRQHNPTISKSELVQALKEMGIEDSVMATAIFDFFDTDHTNSIDFHEFVVATTLFTHGTANEKVAFMHVLCDRQHNGLINRTDLRDTLKVLLSLHSRVSSEHHDIGAPTPVRDSTVNDLLDGLDLSARIQIAANSLSNEIMIEAAPNGVLDKATFTAWVNGKSKTALHLVALFERLELQFTPVERRHVFVTRPAPPSHQVEPEHVQSLPFPVPKKH